MDRDRNGIVLREASAGISGPMILEYLLLCTSLLAEDIGVFVKCQNETVMDASLSRYRSLKID